MTDRDKRNLDEAMRFGWGKIQSRHYHALKVEIERLDKLHARGDVLKVAEILARAKDKE